MKINKEFENCLKSFKEFKDGEEEEKVPNEEDEQAKIREYQAKKDYMLDAGGADVIDCYMELIVQFGFITLFSEVFPLAAMFSLLSNNIQINS
jgi:hypothetical protein